MFQPLDIAYVAAVLEKDHKVRIIDSPTEGLRNLRKLDAKKYRVGLEEKELEHQIRQWLPDVVGITVPFSGWSQTAFETASVVKTVDKEIPTVLQGLHPTTRPEECLSHSAVDFVVIGEPEQTVSEVVNVLEQGETRALERVRGIAFKKKGTTVITDLRPPIEDLDLLPFPSRHLLPMEAYFAAVKENPLRGKICKPWAAVLTSRGCPYSCVFCTKHIVMGKKWRARSPENVVEELEELTRTYKVEQIDFVDDNLTLDMKRMERICDLIVERGLDIEWYAPDGVRADALDENLLRKMSRSGCKKLRLAPESGVQRVVNEIVKKNLDLKKVDEAVVLSKKMGIEVGCFFVIGLIGETKEDIKKSIAYARKLRKLGADSFVFSIATPVYGTQLYRQAKQGGYLRPIFSDEALSSAEPLIETPDFTAGDLRLLCNEGNMINPTFTRDKLIHALQNPKKTLQFLIGKLM